MSVIKIKFGWLGGVECSSCYELGFGGKLGDSHVGGFRLLLRVLMCLCGCLIVSSGVVICVSFPDSVRV